MAILFQGCRLGDDLDANEVVGVGLARALDRQNGLERGDRHGEFGGVRLAGRELLQLEARPHDRRAPSACGDCARPT